MISLVVCNTLRKTKELILLNDENSKCAKISTSKNSVHIEGLIVIIRLLIERDPWNAMANNDINRDTFEGPTENTIKLVLLGESEVGKTCLLSTYLGRDFDPDQKNTVGSNYIYKSAYSGGWLYFLNQVIQDD